MKTFPRILETSAARRGNLIVAAVFGLVLAYGVGFWMTLLHGQSGSSLLVHGLRDSTIALPAVFLAMVLAARSVTPREGASLLVRRAYAVGAAAPAASLVFAAGYALQATLLGGNAGDALPLPLRVARDGLLSLGIALPLAALAATAALREPGRVRSARVSRIRAVGIAVGASVAAAAFLGGSVHAADPGPGTPCPAAAPVKSFNVQAIDVDITLNRFGDHDPTGKMYVLSNRVAAVRAEETAPLPNRVSTGLGNDAIQPLAIRANEGDCVEINFTNNASGGPFGVHIDGLAFEAGSSGDAVGQNFASDVAGGGTRTYRYYVPNNPAAEGAHYLRPGPGNRQAVAHGLFGVLNVEPPNSTYLNVTDGTPLESGWEATIVPGDGKPSFREFTQIYHEIGDESFLISTKDGGTLPLVDPTTTSYRPGSRAMNYRSEPFMNRLIDHPKQESQGYGSYAFGDPATPMMRGYLKDPTKIRLVHGGGEMFHVFHLHGGGDRWRFNPLADKTSNYADTGLNKYPVTKASPSTRLDSQAFGPGESYNLEIEGGAGGVQQAAGDFLYHCHIAEHYISGMWSFWRVYDTKQPDLAPLPDRVLAPAAVDSAALIGKTFNGMTITAANLDDWIRPQLPPQGVQHDNQDASVWNWSIDKSNASAPVYLGEPEDTGPWPDLPNLNPTHPGSLITDLAPGQIVSTSQGDRPKIQFNPMNGRPAWPLMRPHVGARPPFSTNGHSGAPYLGENGGTTMPAAPAVNPWAARADSICPAGAPLRHFNVVAITLPIANTRTKTDPNGMIYTLAQNKDGVYAGTKPAEPLAIRSNIGDCDAVTLTSEETDASQASGFAKVNMHIHHVQFDPQASDGVITGMSYEQSVRPYKVEDPTLTAAAAAGDTTLALSNVGKFRHKCADGNSGCDNVWIGIGLGTNAIEVRQIASVDEAANTVTLTKPLGNAHPAGDAAGTEYVQYRWYPDVLLDNVFWHDHVDGIHNWGHGLVGQLIVEPAGSTYHDPKTGAEVDSGTIVDIHTSNPLLPGVVDGSFREMALWTIDENPNTDATLNLKAEPWTDRLTANPDPSLLFSSYTHGDPLTPLPKAYPGDPVVVRTINVGPTVDGLHIDGHRFTLENRYLDAAGKQEASQQDTLEYGISEKYTLILSGGAGGPQQQPGDYLYENSVARKFRDGAWGILRVLPGQSSDLQPLPGTSPPAAAALPAQTGGRPPAASDSGSPCPAAAPVKDFAISAVDVNLSNGLKGPSAAFVTTASAANLSTRSIPQPLVLHVAAGDCVVVAFTNKRATARSSFHAGMLLRTADSGGVNVGYNPEQTVAPGGTRTYRFYADDARYETSLISDFGGANASLDSNGSANPLVDPARDGMYGAIEVAPPGATFTNAVLGGTVSIGSQVDVHVPGKTGYRDVTLFLADQDPVIGQNEMPYPTDVKGAATINYATAGARADGPNMFSSSANGGDPPTPLLKAYPGDPVHIHAIGVPSNEQVHSFSLGGLSWPFDPGIPDVDTVEARGLVPAGVVEAHTVAGGAGQALGDFFYGDLRRPFTVAGMWGLQRVIDTTGCPMFGVDGRVCGAAVTPVPDTTFPTASMTAPAGGATVSGTNVTVSANASDNIGVTAVQFRLDGTDLGAEDTSAPYSTSWDSTGVANGSHTLTAIAHDAANNATTATSVTVTVSNLAPPPPPPPPAGPYGLVAAYGFNEGAGTTFADASGTGNGGSVIGTSWSTAGKYGGALSFNGVSSIATVANSASLALTTGMTLEAWVDPSALGTTWRTLLFKEQPAGMVYTLYGNQNTGKPDGQVDVGGEKNVVGTSGIALNAWTHLALTYDGTAMKLYVNGNLAATTLVPGQIKVSDGVLHLGGNSVWREWFQGLLDEVRIYNRPLSATEIQTDMSTPVGATTPAADSTNPTVALTAPVASTTVSGTTVAVSANASDNVAVAGVQFRLDGNNLGAEDTGAPYSVSWDSTAVSNGPHTLTAIARDGAGNTAPATPVTVTVSNTATPPPPPPPNGLVAAYGFNEGAGTTFADASGTGNGGSVTGTGWSTAGKYGGALSFNGVSSIATVANSASLALTTGMTLEAWVRPAALGTTWRTLLFKEQPGGMVYTLYANQNTGKPDGQVDVGGEKNVVGTAGIPLNAWTHLAVTYDGSSMRLYVNGTLAATTAIGGPIKTSTGVLHLGGNAVWREWFQGLLDEVRVYNRPLSATEIQNDMTIPVAP